MDFWDILLVTGLQLDYGPQITTLLGWLFSQFSNHLTVCILVHSYQLLFVDPNGGSIEYLTEAKADNFHCSPLIYQVSHCMGDDHISQHYSATRISDRHLRVQNKQTKKFINIFISFPQHNELYGRKYTNKFFFLF